MTEPLRVKSYKIKRNEKKKSQLKTYSYTIL